MRSKRLPPSLWYCIDCHEDFTSWDELSDHETKCEKRDDEKEPKRKY